MSKIMSERVGAVALILAGGAVAFWALALAARIVQIALSYME